MSNRFDLFLFFVDLSAARPVAAGDKAADLPGGVVELSKAMATRRTKHPGAATLTR